MLQCETEDVQLTAESLTLWLAFCRLAVLTHSADFVMASDMIPRDVLRSYIGYYIELPTTVINSSSRGTNDLLEPLCALHTHGVQTNIQAKHPHT